MRTHPCSRLRSEVAGGRRDTRFLLELHEGIEGEGSENMSRPVLGEFRGGGAGVLGNEESLELLHIVAHAT